MMAAVKQPEPSEGDELVREQRFFDLAANHLARYREILKSAPEAAAHKGAADGIRKQVEAGLAALPSADESVAFGRFDNDAEETWYVGKHAIYDEAQEAIVVNWKAPVASPFFDATPDKTCGVLRKRDFICERNRILRFDDLVFAQLAEDIARLDEPVMADALLSDLERARTGEMHDIIRTIQAAQNAVMRSDLDQLLVVQGGPGTGKTAVALHRVSWLLFNYRERLAPDDVLVVGPSATFVRYIRKVLPSLGDRDVHQLDFPQLAGVRVARIELEVDTQRLKGELRMTQLIKRGLDDRVGLPDGNLNVQVGASSVKLDREVVEELVGRHRRSPYSVGRANLRSSLRTEVGRRARTSTVGEGVVENLLERIWPQLTAGAFLRDLFGSEARLVRAGGDDFSAADVRRLYRRSAEKLSAEEWSAADVPLLDYADEQIAGRAQKRFGHIVVDEAQDLSPMALNMLSRRSLSGSMTILGDLAQSTGPWARQDWAEVIAELQTELPVRVEELEFGYRVPSEVFDVARRLLPLAAPSVTPPRVMRQGSALPEFVPASATGLCTAATTAAMGYSARGNLVGVICGESIRGELSAALKAEKVQFADPRVADGTLPITLLSADEAKGLEFDAVVVVGPEEIANDGKTGLRSLYVALTRTTRLLTVVHLDPSEVVRLLVGDETANVGDGGGPGSSIKADHPPMATATSQIANGPDPRIVRAIAIALADDVRRSLQQTGWLALLEELSRMLRLSSTETTTPEVGSADDTDSPRRRIVRAIAIALADDVRRSLQQTAWPALLEELSRQLQPPPAENDDS